MATSKLNSFSPTQLGEAVSQILHSTNFWTVNSHVAQANRIAVVQGILQHGAWPEFPLFSPYAKTHDGYSQGELSPHPFHIVLLSEY